MKKTSFKKLLFAAAVGVVVTTMASCSVDESNDGVNIINKAPVAKASFKGTWIYDGHQMGKGSVSIDSVLWLSDIPVDKIVSEVFQHFTNSKATPIIPATVAQQQMKAIYVGVSQTSRYYNLPATSVIFNATVDGVVYNVKLKTAETGSVVLLQESKNNLSVVVKITETMLQRQDDGFVVADSKKQHTLVFESDINN